MRTTLQKLARFVEMEPMWQQIWQWPQAQCLQGHSDNRDMYQTVWSVIKSIHFLSCWFKQLSHVIEIEGQSDTYEGYWANRIIIHNGISSVNHFQHSDDVKIQNYLMGLWLKFIENKAWINFYINLFLGVYYWTSHLKKTRAPVPFVVSYYPAPI